MRTWSIPWWVRRISKSRRRWNSKSSKPHIINWPLPQAPESSPASEALQLIFADSGLDGKSIMLDLSKLLNEDPNLANQVRWRTGSTFPTNYFLNSNKNLSQPVGKQQQPDSDINLRANSASHANSKAVAGEKKHQKKCSSVFLVRWTRLQAREWTWTTPLSSLPPPMEQDRHTEPLLNTLRWDFPSSTSRLFLF